MILMTPLLFTNAIVVVVSMAHLLSALGLWFDAPNNSFIQECL